MGRTTIKSQDVDSLETIEIGVEKMGWIRRALEIAVYGDSWCPFWFGISLQIEEVRYEK